MRARDGTLEGIRAVLQLGGLRAETHVWLSPGLEEPMATLVDDLAAHWAEWSGDDPKRWSTHEGGLVLSCLHDGLGHIAMTVELRESTGGFGWVARGDVPLEVGQLDALAVEVRRFLEPAA